MREDLRERFTKAHIRIVQEALKYADQTGYLSLQIDNNFYLVESSFQFFAGPFNKEEFTISDNSNIALPPGVDVISAYWLYFAVLGVDNKAQAKIKKLILKVNNSPCS